MEAGKDMGSKSKFQKEIESIQFPPNVQTRIFVGDKDDIVDSSDDKFKQIAAQLNATIVAFPDADHNSVVPAAAALLD